MVALLEPTRLSPEEPSTHGVGAEAVKADRLFDAGMLDEALLAYTAAVQRSGGDFYLLNNRGATYARLGMYESALVDFSHAAELSPKHPAILRHKAFVLAEMDRFSEALDVLSGLKHPLIDKARSAIVRLRLQRIAESGFATWDGGKPKGSKKLVKLTPGPSITELVHEGRR
jgi:regulator of sirC expression with transglutaminase-like and TPR domain